MPKNVKVKKGIKCAVLGYGPAFNMGKAHCEWIKITKGLNLVAVCDLDPKRTKAAKADFPGIKTYNNLDMMLKKQEAELVTIVTPHNAHAPLAIQCLKAGRNVIVEKPMCITAAEATIMIEEAKKRNLILTVFHNRRYDGDYIALKEAIDKKLIGNVFQIETFLGGFRHPGLWWRSDKSISGGAFHDWGAHFVDWVLNIVPEKIEGVTGFYHKRVWEDVTNEDQVEAVIRFESGTEADVQISNIASVGKPRWRVLGTRGGITDGDGKTCFKLVTYVDGKRIENELKYKETDYPAYYRNIAAHLLRGEKLKVKPEEARRVIAVIEAAEKSAKSGVTEKSAYP